jgi:hypothetical protein
MNCPETDEASRGDAIEPRATLAVGLRDGEIAATRAERFHDRALRLFHVDRERPYGCTTPSISWLTRSQDDNSILRRVFDQDRQVQFAAAETRNVGVARLSTRNAMLVSISLARRSRRLRDVTYLFRDRRAAMC